MLYDLLNEIENYLDGLRTLQDVEAWVVSRVQSILQSGNSVAIEVANQVDADLIELGEGVLDESALRERWQEYLTRVTPFVIQASVPVHTRTDTASASTGRAYVISAPTAVLGWALIEPNLRMAESPNTEATRGEPEQLEQPNKYLGADLIVRGLTR